MATGEELRGAMRRFPSGIAIVTVDDEGLKLGLTVGSLVSLSLEPALVGISIGLESSLHAPLRRAGRFAVSVLAADQDAIAQHFARSVPPIAQWVGIRQRPSELPEPLVADALAWLECGVAHAYPAGDHTFFVADVLAIELGRDDRGLVYVDGEYRSA